MKVRARFTPQWTESAKILQGVDALKEGREYTILEVFAACGKSAEFRIEFIDGEGPALFDCRVFTVTRPSIPSTWRYKQFDDGSFSLRPEPWSRPGFWESYFDGDPKALNDYEVEKRKILADS